MKNLILSVNVFSKATETNVAITRGQTSLLRHFIKTVPRMIDFETRIISVPLAVIFIFVSIWWIFPKLSTLANFKFWLSRNLSTLGGVPCSNNYKVYHFENLGRMMKVYWWICKVLFQYFFLHLVRQRAIRKKINLQMQQVQVLGF